MTQVPEGRRIFQELTVYENLLMGAFSQKNKSSFKQDIEEIYQRFPRLAERRNQIAGTLSGGEQQMLAMGRALMSKPKLLMLDEPFAGVDPERAQRIILRLKQEGRTAIMVSHEEKLVNLADQVVQLDGIPLFVK